MSTISALYNETATIQSVVRAADALGGRTNTWSTASTVPCRVRQLSAREAELYMRQTDNETFRMYCDPDVTVTTDNRVIVDGRTYRVIAVDDPHLMGEFLQVDMEYTEDVA
jgi:SPP1 family predicted phage head-tail adaptor